MGHAVYNLKLLVTTFHDGTSCPTVLKIKDKDYIFGEHSLFEKLVNFINEEIEIVYSGVKNYKEYYYIEDIELSKTPKLKLKEKNEHKTI